MELDTLLDSYSIRARLVPALLAFLPAGLALWAVYPDPDLGIVAADGVGLFLLSALFAQFARDQGKLKEPGLWQGWGGPPTTALLRHRDGRLDRVTLKRYRDKIEHLMDIQFPSVEAERTDPAAADTVYDASVRFLIEHTRDAAAFPLVYAENVHYGFRRNLWATKPTGVSVAVISAATAMVAMFQNWMNGGMIAYPQLLALLLCCAMIVWWCLRINPSWVRLAADAYGYRLLGASDMIART